MDGTATTTAGTGFAFLPLAAGRRGLALRCMRRFGPDTLLLFCGGVEVGRSALAEALEPGRTVEVPVSRLPRVALPAELRLCTGVAGPDLAPPWEIASADAALGLLGPPAPVVESLRLDHGVLRGVATEKANGLLEPVFYARVNDAAARAVAAEAPAPLAEGGCVFRFAVPLQPADLVEAGLAVDVHMVGLEAPIARFALAPAGGVDAGRVAELEGRLRRLEDAMASGLDALEHALRRRMDAHGERVDAFIEACASLLLDRVAAGEAPAALRALAGGGGGGGPEAAEAAPFRLGGRVELPPDSGHLGFGWHPPERDAGGLFRWMADRALVVSPEPHRPLAGVALEVGHLYGAAEPSLRASFDALPCAVSVERDGDGRRFQVRIAPPGGAAAPCRTLMLEAVASGSPARDGASADARLLSVAVYRLVFDYAE